jgi:hypothetical protein
MTIVEPQSQYQARLEERRLQLSNLGRQYDRIAWARLGVAIALAGMAWSSFVERWFSGLWLVVPVAAFVVLAVVHSRVAEARGRVVRAMDFYQLGLARIEDRWAGLGQHEFSIDGESHLYAGDLDLFGQGSLFELLSTARTRTGQETLARWLQKAASPAEIRHRQAAAAELAPLLDLREDLGTLGSDPVDSIHPDAMIAWGEGPDRLTSRWPRIVAPLLAGLTLAALVWTVAVDTRAAWLTFLGMCGVEWLLVRRFRAEVEQVLTGADRHGREFRFLAGLIRRIEGRSFSSPMLVALQQSLRTEGLGPSDHLARFARLGDMADARRNPMFLLFFWTLAMTQVAFALEAWRRRSGRSLRTWVAAIGEFEALCALGGYAWEHPEDPFPELLDSGTVFEGESLGHPLLARSQCVRNTVCLGSKLRLIVVSGSNMSGKSTLLRTVGVNAVLAFAGAPVRAARLRLSPFRVGATLRIQDSLQAGRSRFYAEIQRIGSIAALSGGDPPVLFLLDEILHGTNSHDRAQGAKGILKALLKSGAVGLVTTHDLALTAAALDLGDQATDVHFDDRIEDGQMRFDYLMKAGVVEKSNAMELMRSLGLDV